VKPQRHAVILELVRESRIPSQEVLRERLAERGIEVAQATLSRDIRELGLVKVPDENGGSVYQVPPGVTDPTPTLTRLMPSLYVGADGVGNLLVVKTLVGGAQTIAVGIDWEEWPEVVGTIAGDDTVLIVLRSDAYREDIVRRLEDLAGIEPPGR
jgi:transcriptional regulator of arginine metabolism